MMTINKILRTLFNLICVSTLVFANHFEVQLETTGQSQLSMFMSSISSLDSGDEIGVFDNQAILNYNDCSNQLGELLVGAGVWDASQNNVVSIGSVDMCAFGGVQVSGYVEGNPLVVKVFKALQVDAPEVLQYHDLI